MRKRSVDDMQVGGGPGAPRSPASRGGGTNPLSSDARPKSASPSVRRPGNIAGRLRGFGEPPPLTAGDKPKLQKKSATALLGGGAVQKVPSVRGLRPERGISRRASDKKIMEEKNSVNAQPPSRAAASAAAATGSNWNRVIKHHGKPAPSLHHDSVHPPPPPPQQQPGGASASLSVEGRAGEDARERPGKGAASSGGAPRAPPVPESRQADAVARTDAKSRGSKKPTKTTAANRFFATSSSSESESDGDIHSSNLVDALRAGGMKTASMNQVLSAAGLDSVVDLTEDGEEHGQQQATSHALEGDSKNGERKKKKGKNFNASNSAALPGQEKEERSASSPHRQPRRTGGNEFGRLHPPLSSSNMDVSFRSFLITGGTQGLGLEIARQLKRHGATGIVLVSRSEDRGKKACEELNDNNCRCVFIRADLGKADEASSVVPRAVEAMKNDSVITGIVNAAAITARGNLFTETADGFDQQMAVNVRAPFLITQAFAREMKKRELTGSVVNICSVAAHGGAPFIMAYSASKAALVNLIKTNAAELAPIGVRVNGINMGQCLTENEDKLQRKQTGDDNWCLRADRNVPLGRILRPADVGPTVVFLLSDASAMITGSVLDLHPDFPHGRVSLLTEDVR